MTDFVLIQGTTQSPAGWQRLAAELDRRGHACWLAAMVPDGRRALLDEARSCAAEMFNPEWLGQDPTADPALAAYFLFHDTDLATLRWALGTLRRFRPAKLYRHPVEPAGEIPSTYIISTQDRTVRPSWSRREGPPSPVPGSTGRSAQMLRRW